MIKQVEVNRTARSPSSRGNRVLMSLYFRGPRHTVSIIRSCYARFAFALNLKPWFSANCDWHPPTPNSSNYVTTLNSSTARLRTMFAEDNVQHASRIWRIIHCEEGDDKNIQYIWWKWKHNITVFRVEAYEMTNVERETERIHKILLIRLC